MPCSRSARNPSVSNAKSIGPAVCCVVALRTEARDYLIEESLISIEEEFAGIFVRVHRNALVAHGAIAGVERGMHSVDTEGEGEKAQESWQVILRGVAERLPISRRQWPMVKALVKP